jgi:hypothetical protein
MTADTAVDVTELTDLDWQPTFPCEGTRHDQHHVPKGDARFIQRGTCPTCGKPAPDIYVCEGGRQYRLMCDRTTCWTGCGQSAPTDRWGFTFTPIPRSARG